MEGIGYWLFLLIMYLLSGYKKKLQQKQKHKEIESEDGWDSEGIPFSPQIQKWFKAQGWIDEESKEQNDTDLLEHQHEDDLSLEEISPVEEEVKKTHPTKLGFDHGKLSNIEQREEEFESQIYHSDLSNRKVVKIHKKKKSLFVNSLVSNSNRLMESFVIKEILDKPKAYRKRIR